MCTCSQFSQEFISEEEKYLQHLGKLKIHEFCYNLGIDNSNKKDKKTAQHLLKCLQEVTTVNKQLRDALTYWELQIPIENNNGEVNIPGPSSVIVEINTEITDELQKQEEEEEKPEIIETIDLTQEEIIEIEENAIISNDEDIIDVD